MALKGLQGYFDVSKSLAELCGQYEFSMNRRMVLDTLPPPVLLLLRWGRTKELTKINFVRSFPHPPHPKCNALLIQLQDRTQNLHSSILVQIHNLPHLSNLNFSSSQNLHTILLAFGTRLPYYSCCAKAAHVQAPHDNGCKKWSWQDGQGQA